jgi:Big-like domain-containing protein/lamin tail-like protein/Ig-like domain-containing protein
VFNNIFSGASDDVLDLDGADAHVEGNIFMNVRQQTPGGDTSSAVSGGSDSGNTSEITIVRNFFYNCDHAALAKEGNFYTIVNNTMVNLTYAAVNFDEPLRPGITPGRGAYFDGNIIRNAPADFVNTNEVSELTVLRSILSRSADPKLVNTNATLATIRSDLSLRPGSIATGTGPNGLDMGAAVPAGASISGEPMSPTAQTSADLVVDGPGITHYRYQLDGGPYSEERPVSSPIELSDLANGTHTVSVVGKNSAGVYQTLNTLSRPWTVNTQSDVRLNEILARNEGAVFVNGETPDMVELYNPGAGPIDLSGMGLTDDPAVPKKFTFPPGSSLGGGQYLTLYADSETGPGIHLGFGLNQNGDGLWLFNANSTLRDSITFGFQAADYSIGRWPNGSWGLTRPTFGGANIAQPAADAHYVKINEWLTRGRVSFPDDFVELYNAEPVPADLSGVFLTDAPQAGVRMHQVPPLSFINGYGFFVFIADGNTNAGADHLGFQLSSDQGEIGLFDRNGTLIDCVSYGPQTPDVSEGRRPSGAVTIAPISPPTPNAPNPGLVPGITVSNVVTALLPMNAVWKYHTNRLNLGTEWRATNYNDSAWPSGPGILADEDPGVLPAPGIGTELSTNSPNGYVITYYFRTSFVMPETNMPGATLSASLLIDDGAVIYVNGVELLRRRMPNTTITFTTLASQNAQDGTVDIVPLSFTNFPPGTNYLAVEVHQGTQNSSDVTFGMSIETTHLVTNYPPRGLVLNEIMANNHSITNPADSTVTDWVEFYNPSSNVVNLVNMSLSDDVFNPQKWVFPPGVTLAPQSYLIVKFDSGSPPSTNAEPVLNTGFGLDNGGEPILLLLAAPEDGGDVLDSLAFGVQAADFTISRVPEVFGPWRLSFPTMGAVNVPATLGSPANLRINEWLANPSGNNNDFIEIYNPEPQPVDLSGLHLTDDLGDHTQYRIPDLSFIGVGEHGFAEFIADGDPDDGPNHVNFGLDGDGEALGLYTATGGRIDDFTFGPQANGVSEGRFPDGAESKDRFPDTATPGASNMRRLASVVINEALSHTDPPLVDAIELFNPTAASVDLSGWFISDRRNDPRKFRIPEGTVLQAGGFIVFTEADFNPQPGIYPSFALSSSEGEDLFLFAANEAGVLLGYRTDVEFGAAENAVSFGQHETSIGFDFTAQSQRTLGASNAYPKIGPAVINEIMYHPPDIGTQDNERDEFIELLNVSGATLFLYDIDFPTNTWRLRDAVDFDFPQGVSLPAGGYLLVVGFDPGTNAAQVLAFRQRYSIPDAVRILGPYDGRLSNDDENIELYKPDGPTLAGEVPYIEVDKVHYDDNYPWASAADGNTNGIGIGMSLQRRFSSQYGNDPVNWVAAAPTAGGPTALVSSLVPAITQQPQSRTVIVNASTSFTVAASGQAPLRYQWRFNGANILRATNATYSIPSAQLTNNGVYSVLVANSLGAVLSARVTLTVQTPPSIVGHPQDRLIPPGETAIFTVTAQGTPPLRYQWKFNGANIGGETNAILVISNVQTNKEGFYSVEVSNDYGRTNSQAATLTVRSAPIVETQPQGTNVFTGSTVTFQVSAVGTAPLRYQWRFNDNPIFGATNTTLTLANVQLQNAGGYSVLITNNIGGTLSAVATLTVTVPPVATVAAFDSAASESGGDNAVFTFTRTGTLGSPLDIFFIIDASSTAQLGVDYSLAASPVRVPAGAASAQLVLIPVNDGQREALENVIVRVIGSPRYVVGAAAVATATIADDDNSVPQVQIGSPADNTRYTAPTNINITALVTDADGPVNKVEFFANVTNKLGEDLATPFAFTWTNPPVGNYSLTVRATDDVGATAVSAPVRVVVATPGFADMFADRGIMVGYTNYFTGNNSTYTKEPGEPRHHHNGNGNGTRSAWLSWTAPSSGTVTMNTIGSGFDTVMVIYTNSNPAAPTVSNLVRIVSNDDVNNTNVNSQVVFDAVAGVSYQIAMDGYVAGVGGPLVFRMNLPNPNPIILANPTNQLVNPGATVTFSVTAGGPGPLRYQWRFGSSDILNATNSTFTITGVQAANQGIYTVVVSNNAGFVTSSPATLSLRPPPSITTPLVNRVVNPGGSTSFTVDVGGSGPFTYQWRFNGNIMSGATSASLPRNNIQHSQGGTYLVTVSNGAGSTTSQAELIVRPVIARAALSNNVLVLSIDATPGKTYFMQTGTNLVDWADVQELAPGTVRSEFQTPVTATNRMFRLRVP